MKLNEKKKYKVAPVPILWCAECVDFDLKCATNRFHSAPPDPLVVFRRGVGMGKGGGVKGGKREGALGGK